MGRFSRRAHSRGEMLLVYYLEKITLASPHRPRYFSFLFLYFFPCFSSTTYSARRRESSRRRDARARSLKSATFPDMHDVSFTAHFEILHLMLITPRHFGQVRMYALRFYPRRFYLRGRYIFLCFLGGKEKCARASKD